MSNFFKNPYINSVLAEVYIVFIVAVLHYFGTPNTPDTFLDPVAALSIFVLSAAVMGYLFVGEPLQLYISGEKKQAIAFFLRTVLSFATITLAIAITLKLLR